jgi:hypothetical protein
MADGMTVSALDKQTSFKATLGKYKTNKNEEFPRGRRGNSWKNVVSNGWVFLH